MNRSTYPLALALFLTAGSASAASVQLGVNDSLVTIDSSVAVLRPTRMDMERGPAGYAVTVWTYEAVSAGETSIRNFRTEGMSGPELESRTISFRVSE